jgi:hypothetical protein
MWNRQTIMNDQGQAMAAIVLSAFRIKIDRLAKLVESDDLDDALELAANMRHLLVDGVSLAQDSANLLGLALAFPVTDEVASARADVFKSTYSPASNAETWHKIASFLNLPAYCADQFNLTVHEIIDAVANAGGGVHHRGDDTAQEQAATQLLLTDPNGGLEALQGIGRAVMRGVEVLREGATRQATNLVQRKRSLQPRVWMNEARRSAIYFDGSAYMEAYAEIGTQSGFTTVIALSLPSEVTDSCETLFEIGNRDERTAISLLRCEQRFLTVSCTTKGEEVWRARLKLSADLRDAVSIQVHSADLPQITATTSVDTVKSPGLQNWPSEVRGKSVVGADCRGRSRARMQFAGTASWSTLQPQDEVRKIRLAILQGLPGWIERNAGPEGVFVTTMYNQNGSASK